MLLSVSLHLLANLPNSNWKRRTLDFFLLLHQQDVKKGLNQSFFLSDNLCPGEVSRMMSAEQMEVILCKHLSSCSVFVSVSLIIV